MISTIWADNIQQPATQKEEYELINATQSKGGEMERMKEQGGDERKDEDSRNSVMCQRVMFLGLRH